MPVLSFRFKLVVAMMLVVAGVSVTTLLITQRRVQATYERTFRNQFERQINYFVSLQEARLASVKEQCLKLSQSAPLLTALEQAKVDSETVYLNASNELRTVLFTAAEQSRMAGISGPRRFQATFFRFLDGRGKPLDPPENLRRQLATAGYAKRLIEQKIERIRGALDSPEVQQVGYLAVAQQTNRPLARANAARKTAPAPPPENNEQTNAPSLQEVVVTKIIDEGRGGGAVGAMVIGFPVPELIPQPKNDNTNQTILSESIQSGILLEDHFYANPNALPEPMAAQVGQQLVRRLLNARKPRDEFDCQIQNKPYRIFYQLLNQGSAFPPAYQACVYSMAEALQEQKALRWEIVGLGGLALIAALFLSLLLSHGLSVPIRELVTGTEEIRHGNFAVTVPIRSQDELGQLAASFNEMAVGLAQKERYRTVLNLVADEKVAEQLVNGEIALGGELREVSILFCDIRNFTALTQHMPPGEVIEMVNEHMTALTRVVKEHNGVLDKFVGDLLMAVFGAPVTHGNDALHAAQCALGLLRQREALNQVSRYQLSIGLGLATGPVVAGCMGSTDRLNYTVLGERVNLASRLCDHARPGEVLIDQTTVERLGHLIVAEPTSVLELKGFAANVQAYRLREVLPVATVV